MDKYYSNIAGENLNCFNLSIPRDPIKISSKEENAVLIFQDGTFFLGKGLGKKAKAVAEICFNVSMTGYQEIMTDPSYNGQIICFTFPHIGIVGCNKHDYESEIIHCDGIIVREEIGISSNFRSEETFSNWLERNNVTGICNVDTRQITRLIRSKGPQMCLIYHGDVNEEINITELLKEIKDLPDLEGQDLAIQVSTKKSFIWKKEGSFSLEKNTHLSKHKNNGVVVVIDFGVKNNILHKLQDLGFFLIVVSLKTSWEEILNLNPDGIFLSNGPGDPLATAEHAASLIRKILKHEIPLFGICLGHQLLAIASGLKTQKMSHGHRGANHPVKNLLTNSVEITSQNHGFCVSEDNLPANIEITHISLFDNSIEGIKLKNKPAFSVQYHPESSPGPHDSAYLFEQFAKLINDYRLKKINNFTTNGVEICQEEMISTLY